MRRELSPTGANRDAEVQTLPEYRDKYRLYQQERSTMRTLRRFRVARGTPSVQVLPS